MGNVWYCFATSHPNYARYMLQYHLNLLNIDYTPWNMNEPDFLEHSQSNSQRKPSDEL